MEKEYINTADMYVTSVVVCECSVVPIMKSKGPGLILFDLPNTPEVRKVMDAYTEGILTVNALSLTTTLRKLKYEMRVFHGIHAQKGKVARHE